MTIENDLIVARKDHNQAQTAVQDRVVAGQQLASGEIDLGTFLSREASGHMRELSGNLGSFLRTNCHGLLPEVHLVDEQARDGGVSGLGDAVGASGPFDGATATGYIGGGGPGGDLDGDLDGDNTIADKKEKGAYLESQTGESCSADDGPDSDGGDIRQAKKEKAAYLEKPGADSDDDGDIRLAKKEKSLKDKSLKDKVFD